MTGAIFIQAPVIEFLAFVIWVWSVVKAWRGVVAPVAPDAVDERTLGAAVIMGQLNAVITGSSIILAGVGAFIALKADHTTPTESYHLFYAVASAVLALGIALYTMSTLPTRAPRENFVRSFPVAVLCAVALFLCLAAGARFLCAVGAILLFK